MNIVLGLCVAVSGALGRYTAPALTSGTGVEIGLNIMFTRPECENFLVSPHAGPVAETTCNGRYCRFPANVCFLNSNFANIEDLHINNYSCVPTPQCCLDAAHSTVVNSVSEAKYCAGTPATTTKRSTVATSTATTTPVTTSPTTLASFPLILQACCGTNCVKYDSLSEMVGLECCGTTPVNFFAHICCGGVASDRRVGSKNYERCCGTKAYAWDQTCCDGQIFNGTNLSCCGSQAYNIYDVTSICCSGVLARVSIGNVSPACCGTRVYDASGSGGNEINCGYLDALPISEDVDTTSVEPDSVLTEAKSCKGTRSPGTSTCSNREPGRRYYYVRSRNKCYAFNYRGCGGNGNRYNTFAECTEACAPTAYKCDSLGNVKRDRKGACARKAFYYWSVTAKNCGRTRGCPIGENQFPNIRACRAQCLTT